MRTSLIVVGAVSWVVSAVLIVDVWRSKDPLLLKAMFGLLLLMPILGPILYLWIRSFPGVNHAGLMDQQRYELDLLNRWRHRFERAGWLPGRWWLKSKSSEGRQVRHSQSFSSEAEEAVAQAQAREAKRMRKQLRKARLYKRPGKRSDAE